SNTSPPLVSGPASVCTVSKLPSSYCRFSTISTCGRPSRASSASMSSCRKPSTSVISSTPAASSSRRCRSRRLRPPKLSRHFGSCCSALCCSRDPRPAARMMARMNPPGSDVSLILQKSAPGVRVGDRALRATPDPLAVMQVDQARHTEQDLAGALRERERKRRVGRESRERREQKVTALLHTEGAGYRERRAPDRLPEALEQQRVAPAHGRAQHSQCEIDLAGADQPADEAQCEARRRAFPAPVGVRHRKVDRV